MNLPVPKFIKNERQIEKIEILLKRLESVSPLVRERAASQLADLLEKDIDGELHRAFVEWLQKQTLETFTCYGLLILLKSLSNSQSQTFQHLILNKLEVPANCFAVEILLLALNEKLNQKFEILSVLTFSLPSEKPTISDKTFFKKIGAYLQNIYRENIISLQNETGLEVWRIWYGFYLNKCKELKIVENSDDLNYGHNHNHIIGYSPIISEIFKSTYFKTLDYLYHLRRIEYGSLFHYTVLNFPVDVSLWNIELKSPPSWWSKFKSIPDTLIPDLSIAQIETPITQIINIEQSKTLLFMHGSIVTNEDHYKSTLQGTIRLLPFAYKVTGSELPVAEEIYHSIDQNTGTWQTKITKISKFGFFENPLDYRNLHGEETFKIKDLQITPLIAHFRPRPHHIWQYFRMFSPIFLLTPILSESLTLNTNRYLKYEKDQSTICEISDFCLGIRDVSAYSEDVPCGTHILIDNDYLNQFLSKNNLRLGYVYETRLRTRSSFHSHDFEEVNQYETIGLSSIILP